VAAAAVAVVGGDQPQWEPPQAGVALVDARHEGAQRIECVGSYNSGLKVECSSMPQVKAQASYRTPRLLQSGGFGGWREGSAGATETSLGSEFKPRDQLHETRRLRCGNQAEAG
jgi:hypothetical protein